MSIIQPRAVGLRSTDVPASRARLVAAYAVHGVVDFFSFIVVPLLPVLRGRLDLTDAQVAQTIALGSIASGLIQPVVAWASDRLHTRSLGTIGFVAAVIALSIVGHATTFAHLLILYAIGAAGIGAFHPVAAAAVGHLSGSRRSLGVAVFYLSGMIGGTLGSALSPVYVKAFGLDALVYLLAPGLASCAALALAIHAVPHRHHDAHRDHAALTRDERRGRWATIGLLYLGNVIRFTVNMALVHLIVVWSEREAKARAGSSLPEAVAAHASTLNGSLQAAMQVGMGAAGILAGLYLRARGERLALVIAPIVGAAAALALPHAGSVVWIVGVIAGVGFGGFVPVTIAMAQRLLPHRTSLASGLMMGGAWALAFLGPPMAHALDRAVGLEHAFGVVAGILLVSSALAALLPE